MKRSFLFIIVSYILTVIYFCRQQYGWMQTYTGATAITPSLIYLYFVSYNKVWICCSTRCKICYTTDKTSAFTLQTTTLLIIVIHMVNPAKGNLEIKLYPESSIRQHAYLPVKEVTILIDEFKPAGSYEVKFQSSTAVCN